MNNTWMHFGSVIDVYCSVFNALLIYTNLNFTNVLLCKKNNKKNINLDK